MQKLVFIVLGPFRIALFPELWNAGHHKLGNPLLQQAHAFTAIGTPDYDCNRFGSKVLQENHPYGPDFIFAGILVFSPSHKLRLGAIGPEVNIILPRLSFVTVCWKCHLSQADQKCPDARRPKS